MIKFIEQCNDLNKVYWPLLKLDQKGSQEGSKILQLFFKQSSKMASQKEESQIVEDSHCFRILQTHSKWDKNAPLLFLFFASSSVLLWNIYYSIFSRQMLRRSSQSFTHRKLPPLSLQPIQNQLQLMNRKSYQRPHSAHSSKFIIRRKVAYSTDQVPLKPDQVFDRYESPRSLERQKIERKTYKIRQCIHEPPKSKDLNLKEKDENARILQQFYEPIDLNCSFFKSSSLNNFNYHQPFTDISTSKSLVRKGKKKIQQCKIRKINWKQNNKTFDLGISAIKQNLLHQQTPPESLHQLFIQIL